MEVVICFVPVVDLFNMHTVCGVFSFCFCLQINFEFGFFFLLELVSPHICVYIILFSFVVIRNGYSSRKKCQYEEFVCGNLLFSSFGGVTLHIV
jgi:hypothetical protein